MNTTQGQLYLLRLDTLERLEIQFVPLTLDYSRNSRYGDVRVIGRNNPLYHYAGSATTLNLELDFHSYNENRTDVIEKVNWLERATMANGYLQQPPELKLIFGDLLADKKWILERCNPTLQNFDKPSNFLPKQAYVSLRFREITDTNKRWNEIRL